MAASNVIVDNTGERFACAADATVLAAGLAAGLLLPPDCENGGCGDCKALILSGDVRQEPGPALAAADAAQGFCLPCRATPVSPRLHLRLLAPVEPMTAAADAIEPQRFEAEVIACPFLAPSIREVVLAPTPDASPRYRAGMYMEFELPGVTPHRVYSMIDAPGPDGRPRDGLLRFYVTRHEEGQASGWLHDRLRPGMAVALHGPFGDFCLIPEAMESGFVGLAGGSGLGPVLALADQALTDGCREDVTVLLSVRTMADVYARDRLHGLAGRFPNFRYAIAVTRETPPAGPTWRSGRLPEFLQKEGLEMAAQPVYIAGPPDFVAACEVAVTGLGVLDSQLRVESYLA